MGKTNIDDDIIRVLGPIDLGPDINGRISYIKEKYQNYFSGINVDPYIAITGAFYALRIECSTNPEWKSQAGHSIREIMYPLVSKEAATILTVFNDLLKHNQDVAIDYAKLSNYYQWFTDLAHHCVQAKIVNSDEYNTLKRENVEAKIRDFLYVFETVLNYQQIYIHKCIDLVTAKNIPELKNDELGKTKRHISTFVNYNQDSRSYFFNKVNSKHIDWLSHEEYFKCLNPHSNVVDISAELQYLDRASKDQPDSVVSVILNTKISKSNFNPDVVSRFVRIMSSLPADQLVSLIAKLKRESWVKLLNRFNHWGFEYEDMFKTLLQAQNYQAILDLVRVVLSVKEMTDLRGGSSIYNDTFYFDNLGETGVFTALHCLPIKHQESALYLISTTLCSVVDLWDNQSEKNDKPDNPFEKNDHFMLASYIPSDIKPGEQGGGRRDDNLYDLTASLLHLFDSLVANNPDLTISEISTTNTLLHSQIARLCGDSSFTSLSSDTPSYLQKNINKPKQMAIPKLKVHSKNH